MSTLDHSISLNVSCFLDFFNLSWHICFSLLSAIALIVSLDSTTVLVIRSFTMALDVCLLIVFPVRNLSLTYKSVINKESLMLPEFHRDTRVLSSWHNYFLCCLALSRK